MDIITNCGMRELVAVFKPEGKIEIITGRDENNLIIEVIDELKTNDYMLDFVMSKEVQIGEKIFFDTIVCDYNCLSLHNDKLEVARITYMNFDHTKITDMDLGKYLLMFVIKTN